MQIYEAFFDSVTASIDLSTALARVAYEQAARWNLNACDALHVAAALQGKADQLVTAEDPAKPLCQVTDVRVISLRTQVP